MLCCYIPPRKFPRCSGRESRFIWPVLDRNDGGDDSVLDGDYQSVLEYEGERAFCI